MFNKKEVLESDVDTKSLRSSPSTPARSSHAQARRPLLGDLLRHRRRGPRRVGRLSFKWSQVETSRFFHALALLGTDFSLIATLFEGKSECNILHKFKRERRQNPARLEEALDRAGRRQVTQLSRRKGSLDSVVEEEVELARDI